MNKVFVVYGWSFCGQVELMPAAGEEPFTIRLELGKDDEMIDAVCKFINRYRDERVHILLGLDSWVAFIHEEQLGRALYKMVSEMEVAA